MADAVFVTVGVVVVVTVAVFAAMVVDVLVIVAEFITAVEVLVTVRVGRVTPVAGFWQPATIAAISIGINNSTAKLVFLIILNTSLVFFHF